MRLPDDPLGPRAGVFAEPWHAQVLAAAHSMVRAGHISNDEWAQALGAALKAGEALGRPDTDESYYLAALEALESLVPIDREDLEDRKASWAEAYRRTPHGQPVHR